MASKYGKPELVRDTNERLKKYDEIKNDPYRYNAIVDKKTFNDRYKRLKAKSEKITPPPIADGREGDRLMKRQKQLEEFMVQPCEKIRKPEMTSNSDNWKVPAGTVGRLRTVDDRIKNYNLDANGNPYKTKDGYGAFFEWKDNQRRLYDQDEQLNDPDLASIESFRPQNSSGSKFIDYRRMTFAPGAHVTEEQYDAAVGRTPVKAQKVEGPARPKCQGVAKLTGAQCNFWARKGYQMCIHHKDQEPSKVTESQPVEAQEQPQAAGG